jgi:pyridoxamine 5'-phosphate oxidase
VTCDHAGSFRVTPVSRFSGRALELEPGVLDFGEVLDPLQILDAWREEARARGSVTPDAMTLSTVDSEGRPRARTVFLRGRRPRRLEFFTNYESQKGRDLLAHPWATCLFYFPELERQVSVSGPVVRSDRVTSESYFRGRPRDSQLGAWASRQSEPIESRAALLAAFQAVEQRFLGQEVPCPANWGGYVLEAERVELWIGVAGRLHHRGEFEYRAAERSGQREWVSRVLFP